MISSHSIFHLDPNSLLLAFLLDLAIGDPRWLPHPVTIIGRAISQIESRLRSPYQTPRQEKWLGTVLTASIVISVLLIASLLSLACLILQNKLLLSRLGQAVIIYLVSTTMASRTLIESARLVIESIKDKSLTSARAKLSMIVGRDTGRLSEKEVLRATIETVSENLSDGIIAPLFYLTLGGLPLAMTYKAINTLDSMVGYKNERYLYFGWASARLDDLANYLPARISGFLIAVSAPALAFFSSQGRPYQSTCWQPASKSWQLMLKDGRNHPSPNSGLPEAAMAGALGVKLGGPSTYGGELVEKPSIGETVTDDYLTAAEQSLIIVHLASWLGLGLAFFLTLLRSSL